MRYLKPKFIPISLCLSFVFFGCMGAPRVRIVRGDDRTFHFQWDKPLKEKRIILVRLSGVNFDHRYKAEHPHEEELLVFFPPGTVVSNAIDRPRALEFTSMAFLGRIDSVEILPAHLRNTIRVPARLYKVAEYNHSFEVHGDKVILRDYPFFRQKYRICKPSRITFEE